MFRVDPSASEPIFAQLAAQVRSAIAHRGLAIGDRLPAARELADALQINVHTVLRAYQLLRDEGTLELRRGRGAVVAAGPDRDHAKLLSAITTVVDEAAALGLSPEATATLVKEAFRQ